MQLKALSRSGVMQIGRPLSFSFKSRTTLSEKFLWRILRHAFIVFAKYWQIGGTHSHDFITDSSIYLWRWVLVYMKNTKSCFILQLTPIVRSAFLSSVSSSLCIHGSEPYQVSVLDLSFGLFQSLKFFYYVTYWPRLKLLFHEDCFMTFSEFFETAQDNRGQSWTGLKVLGYFLEIIGLNSVPNINRFSVQLCVNVHR